MFSIRVIGADVLAAKFSAGMSLLLPEFVGKVGEEARQVLAKAPGGPSYPIAWTSEAQRRCVLALLGGQPYHRSGRLSSAWAVHTGGNTAVVENPTPYAVYVQGESQQRFLSAWTTIQQAAAQVEGSSVIGSLFDRLVQSFFG